MEKILNITNGDSAVAIMRRAGIGGEFLPWRDVLHEGPVPAGLSLEQLSRVRAQFITGRNWGTAGEIGRSFAARDNLLKSSPQFTKIILWFEHDLYDQLQILQVLDWFSNHPLEGIELSIICTDNYLGTLSPVAMEGLRQYQKPVTASQLALARKAWAAFCNDSPAQWLALLEDDTSSLPFLKGAVLRMVEEYPDCATGLSRTEHQALEIIAGGEKRPARIFGRYQESEDRRFMGDLSFRYILQQMLEENPPLLSLAQGNKLCLPMSPDQELSITPAGKNVLAGRKNRLDSAGMDRWIGGVHLVPENCWCRKTGSTTLSLRQGRPRQKPPCPET